MLSRMLDESKIPNGLVSLSFMAKRVSEEQPVGVFVAAFHGHCFSIVDGSILDTDDLHSQPTTSKAELDILGPFEYHVMRLKKK